jgi:hypothetical protein
VCVCVCVCSEIKQYSTARESDMKEQCMYLRDMGEMIKRLGDRMLFCHKCRKNQKRMLLWVSVTNEKKQKQNKKWTNKEAKSPQIIG